MTNRNSKPMSFVIVGLCLSYGLACSRSTSDKSSSVKASSSTAAATNKTEAQKPAPQSPEPKSAETTSVQPQVQSQIESMEAQKRVSVLADAVLALDATRIALTALDKGDKTTALAALERASGKLDVVLSRDPKLAFAPVDVRTTTLDLYASLDTVRAVVKDVKDDLANNRVQLGRHLMSDLASEADTQVTEIPLATYPAAIKAVVPLIDAGKTEEAKAALESALSTLVTVTYVIPLPSIRAQAMLRTLRSLPQRTTESSRMTRKCTILSRARARKSNSPRRSAMAPRRTTKRYTRSLTKFRSRQKTGSQAKGCLPR